MIRKRHSPLQKVAEKASIRRYGDPNRVAEQKAHAQRTSKCEKYPGGQAVYRYVSPQRSVFNNHLCMCRRRAGAVYTEWMSL
jgi:hypothetical protein